MEGEKGVTRQKTVQKEQEREREREREKDRSCEGGGGVAKQKRREFFFFFGGWRERESERARQGKHGDENEKAWRVDALVMELGGAPRFLWSRGIITFFLFCR